MNKKGNGGKYSGKLNFGDNVGLWNFHAEMTESNKQVFQVNLIFEIVDEKLLH